MFIPSVVRFATRVATPPLVSVADPSGVPPSVNVTVPPGLGAPETPVSVAMNKAGVFADNTVEKTLNVMLEMDCAITTDETALVDGAFVESPA